MEADTFTLTLTPAEVAFVAGLLGGSPRLLQDPFAGWSEQRIEAALARAQDSLISRQYAQLQPDGRLAVDTTAAGLVGALAFAESALTITRLVGDVTQPSIRRIHCVAGLIVEQEERDSRHELTAVRDRETLLGRVQEYVRLGNHQAIDVEPCIVSASDLYEARCVAVVEGDQASAQILKEAGAPAATASALARAMAGMECQSALAALRWEGQDASLLGRFTLLLSKRGAWLLKPLPGDADRIEVLSCDTASAAREVEDLVNAIVPSMPDQRDPGALEPQG